MIYLRLSNEKHPQKEGFYKVEFIHYIPFDPVDGLKKTKEELLETGLLVDEIPAPTVVDGQEPFLYANQDGELDYVYFERQKTLEEKQMIAQQEAAVKLMSVSEDTLLNMDLLNSIDDKLNLIIKHLGIEM